MVLGLGLIGLLVGGCASDTAGEPVRTSAGSACVDQTVTDRGDFTPTAAVMIEISDQSGWSSWPSLPGLVVYADGSVVTAMPATQSGVATSSAAGGGLLPWAVGHIPGCELEEILADLAVVNPAQVELGQPKVFDADAVSVVVHGVGGAAPADYRAYALSRSFDDGLGAAQVQARERLRAVIDRAGAAVQISGSLPVGRVEVTALLSNSGPGFSDAPATWPLARTPMQVRAGKRCAVLDGADAQVVATAVPKAAEASTQFAGTWSVPGGDSELLLVRVLPPGVAGCG